MRELFTNYVLFLIQGFIKLGSSISVRVYSLFILNYGLRIPFLVCIVDILSKWNFRRIQRFFLMITLNPSTFGSPHYGRLLYLFASCYYHNKHRLVQCTALPNCSLNRAQSPVICELQFFR
jgi:hypothetical protein